MSVQLEVIDRFIARETRKLAATHYASSYSRSRVRLLQEVREEMEAAEKDLQERIWQAWVDLGIEPR